MERLEKLTQDEDGMLYRENGEIVKRSYAMLMGKIRPLVVSHPCMDISKIIDEMAEKDSVSIPKGANAYITSDFSGDTQHLRRLDGKEKFYFVNSRDSVLIFG